MLESESWFIIFTKVQMSVQLKREKRLIDEIRRTKIRFVSIYDNLKNKWSSADLLFFLRRFWHPHFKYAVNITSSFYIITCQGQ